MKGVDYAAGVKAGFIAGLATATFFLASNLVNLYMIGLTRLSVWPTFILIAENDIPYSIIVGLIVGTVFATTHDRFLKGRALELKGVVYGMGSWFILILPSVLLLPEAQFFFSSGVFIVSIAGYLVFGLVLGILFRKFSSRSFVIVP